MPPISRRPAVLVGTLVVVAVATFVLGATPADAHTVSGVGASNLVTELRAVSPEVDGLDVEVIESGSRIELTNDTGTEVVVLGYEEEPYLRVGPDGVFENQNSPATYLNRDRDATAAVPDEADPDAEPDWAKVSDGTTARWHDHRAHWMGRQDPPAARAAPGERHEVQRWTIQMRQGDQLIEATGVLLWVPGPSPGPWYLLAAALAVAFTAVGVVGRSKALAVGVVAAVVVDVVHTIGVVLEADDALAVLVPGSLYSIVAWVVGAWAAPRVWRDRREGLLAAVFVGALMTFFGLIDLDTLSRSQVPFGWPAGVARVCVSVTLGLGVGLTLGALGRLWRAGFLAATPRRPAQVPSEP